MNGCIKSEEVKGVLKPNSHPLHACCATRGKRTRCTAVEAEYTYNTSRTMSARLKATTFNEDKPRSPHAEEARLRHVE